MIKSIVKAYRRKYTTKNKVKPTYTVTKQINIPVDCDLEGDDVVYVLSEEEYKELSDDKLTSTLQEGLDIQSEIVDRLKKQLNEYKEREKIATDILTLNNKLITDNEQLNIELRESDKVANELRLINQLLINRGLLARIVNKQVIVSSDDVKEIETKKE